jgi:hypothetical protein
MADTPEPTTLTLLPDRFAVCRLDPTAAYPPWISTGFVSITRTPDELSLVCPEGCVPVDVQREIGWACLAIRGPLDFGQIGILSSLLDPLAKAEISVFTLSTFTTDYLFIKAEMLDRATIALSGAGHHILLPDRSE